MASQIVRVGRDIVLATQQLAANGRSDVVVPTRNQCPNKCGSLLGAFGMFRNGDVVGFKEIRVFDVRTVCVSCDAYFDTGETFKISS